MVSKWLMPNLLLARCFRMSSNFWTRSKYLPAECTMSRSGHETRAGHFLDELERCDCDFSVQGKTLLGRGKTLDVTRVAALGWAFWAFSQYSMSNGAWTKPSNCTGWGPSASCETMQESGRGPVPRSLAAAGCKDKQQEQQNDAHAYTNPEPTPAKKRLMAFGFLLHYGHLRILCCVDGLVHPGRPRWGLVPHKAPLPVCRSHIVIRSMYCSLGVLTSSCCSCSQLLHKADGGCLCLLRSHPRREHCRLLQRQTVDDVNHIHLLLGGADALFPFNIPNIRKCVDNVLLLWRGWSGDAICKAWTTGCRCWPFAIGTMERHPCSYDRRSHHWLWFLLAALAGQESVQTSSASAGKAGHSAFQTLQQHCEAIASWALWHSLEDPVWWMSPDA